MSKEVVCKTFLKPHEAEMAKGLLDEAGIPSIFLRDDCGRMQPGMTFGAVIKLKVKEEDLEKARKVIQVLEEQISDY
jgi:hypothetical protein